MRNSRWFCFLGGCALIVLSLYCINADPTTLFSGVALCILGVYLLIYGLYLHLLESETGRKLLRKLPVKAIQRRVADYEVGNRYTVSTKSILVHPIYMMAWLIVTGISRWNHPLRTGNAVSIFCFICAGCYGLYIAYLCLYFFPKGRDILKKLPFKRIQRRLAEYQ